MQSGLTHSELVYFHFFTSFFFLIITSAWRNSCLSHVKAPLFVLQTMVLYGILSAFLMHKKFLVALTLFSFTCQEQGSSATQIIFSTLRKSCPLISAPSKISCVAILQSCYSSIVLLDMNIFQAKKADSSRVISSKYCRRKPVVNNHTEENCSPVNRNKVTNNC